jgi:hypothetical protein
MTYKFNNSKYTKWYWELISSRRNRLLPESIYQEAHHIIPKSLGGSNHKTNLINLTAREHFIAHLLLVRMVMIKDVYKMMHAVIRFKAKLSTAKEYELLRSTLHTYSKGEFNTSFGKIWIHYKGTNEINYIKKEMFDATYMKKGLPYQRGGFKNYKWINNGVNESLIPRIDETPTGWNDGRIHRVDIQHIKYMSSKRHTPEKDKEHSQKLKGRIGIYNETTSDYRRINYNELSYYEGLGYCKQSKNPNAKIPKTSKKVTIDGVTFNSIAEAARKLNISEYYVKKYGQCH